MLFHVVLVSKTSLSNSLDISDFVFGVWPRLVLTHLSVSAVGSVPVVNHDQRTPAGTLRAGPAGPNGGHEGDHAGPGHPVPGTSFGGEWRGGRYPEQGSKSGQSSPPCLEGARGTGRSWKNLWAEYLVEVGCVRLQLTCSCWSCF